MTITPDQLTTIYLDDGGHDNPDDGMCLPWAGRRDEDGYGHFGKSGSAHRLAWEDANGQRIPPGLVVMHTCDNPPCINPAHLVLGAIADNNRDRHAKGRTVMPDNGPDFWRNKTHCPQGHPYDGNNVRYRPDGRRRCAACYREREAKRRAANRDEINRRRRKQRVVKSGA
jgi:hypothetical protein